METTVEEIMANRDSYEEKEVLVSGTVSSPKFKASKAGNTYMTFPLIGGSGGRVNILFWGDMRLKPGRKVRVKSIYHKTIEMRKYTFHDVIEAVEIKKG
jgi:hypothetical protein